MSIARSFNEWRRYRATCNELNKLTARELIEELDPPRGGLLERSVDLGQLAHLAVADCLQSDSPSARRPLDGAHRSRASVSLHGRPAGGPVWRVEVGIAGRGFVVRGGRDRAVHGSCLRCGR